MRFCGKGAGMDAVTQVPSPYNEPIRQYQPGSVDRSAVAARIKDLASQRADLTMTVGGRQVMGSGERVPVVQPHNHQHVLGWFGNATDDDVAAAIAAAGAAAKGWRALSFEDRAAVFLRAADLLAGPWRATLNAATILGQSKSVLQAEIDAACELIDFWRYNVAFARQLLAEQPTSAPGTWNRMEYRPLEGFVLAITPFNFTAIAGNLPTAPALLGNVVVWKPSPTQQLAAHYTMRLLEAAGLPPGVINLVTGDGQAVSRVALTHAYIPASLWETVRDDLIATTRSLTYGDVSEDLSLFGGAVIDSRAVSKHRDAFERARSRPSVRFLTGGEIDDEQGYFVSPTVLECDDPGDEVFTTEYFGPILAVHVYQDADYLDMLSQAADVTPYALTGSILATDRTAIAQAADRLRYSAGNFYINDKPTGAVVGQQPFGGARASGTDDKAGSVFNLIRWVSTRSIKETFVPPTDYRYPHMG
jgi:acyl-CoA reductase-like NAD-dependent aldehyde dehydrogenase